MHPLPERMQEGVSVSAAVVYVRPWSEVAASLAPRFENTPANALGQVLQTQSYSDFRLLNALGINFQAGLDIGARTSVTDEATRNVDSATVGGVTETTRDATTQTVVTRRVEDNAPPDLPAASAGAAGGRSAAALPDLIGATRNPTSEPFFRYATAAALYQEIALINDAVQGIPAFAGRKPYIIRMRVGVTPFRRDLPWDVYAHLTLFENSREQSVDPIIILPVLSTDAYEGTLDASALQDLVDLRVGLQAALGNARVGGGLDRLNERLTTFMTRRYESSLRISGGSGTNIHVKFGAARDATDFALGDRDHYVTLIAFLRPPFAGQDPRNYRFYLSHEARDVRTGRRVAPSNSSFFEAVAPLVRALRLTPVDVSDPGCGTPEYLLYNLADQARLEGAQRAFGAFEQCLTPSATARLAPSRQYLMAEALALRDIMPTASLDFQIQPLRTGAAPEFATDIAPHVQATRTAMTVSVPYSGEVELGQVRAILIPEISGAGSFGPRAVTLRTAGSQSNMVLEFPPLTAMNFQNLAQADRDRLRAPPGWRICAALSAEALRACAAAGSHGRDASFYNHILGLGYAEMPLFQAPSFTLSTPVQSVRMSADGLISFGIHVELGNNRPVTLTASGGELMVNGVPVHEISFGASGTHVVTLRNAAPGGIVTLQGTSAAAEDASVKSQEQISVAVQAAAAK